MHYFLNKIIHHANHDTQILADQLNVTKKTINNWQKGISFPSLKQFTRLMYICGVTEQDLLHFYELSLDKYIQPGDYDLMKATQNNKK